jgi:hypothetical protein
VVVVPAEGAVLAVARALFGHRDPTTRGLLHRAQPAAAQLGPPALAVLEEILAVGWVVTLARRGGWRRDGEGGRMWERFAPPELGFSGFALALCQWLAASPLGSGEEPPLEARPESDGDHLLCYLALDLAAAMGADRALARQPALRASPLAWLGFPRALAAHGAADRPDFGPLLAGAGAVVVEVLADELARRWLAVEREQARLSALDEVVAVGGARAAVLAGALDAFDAAGRRDLARFAVGAGAALVAAPPAYGERLERRLTVAERARGRAAAVGFLRGLATIARWVGEARAVRFFDDGYPAAQRLLAVWEPLGDRGYGRLAAVADRLESLRAAEETG